MQERREEKSKDKSHSSRHFKRRTPTYRLILPLWSASTLIYVFKWGF